MPSGYQDRCHCGSGKKYHQCHAQADQINAQWLSQAIHAHQSGQLSQAATLYDSILAQQPAHFDALHMRGVVCYQMNDHTQALAYFTRALALQQEVGALWNNIGNACQALKQFNDAIMMFRKAIELEPGQALYWGNLGNALAGADRKQDATVAWRQSISLDPRQPRVLAMLVLALRELCLWPDLPSLQSGLLRLNPEQEEPAPPFIILATPATAAQQQQWAARFANQLARQAPPQHFHLRPGLARRNKRLTIGYLSSDWCEHATAYLMAELLELHDHQQFRILGYALNPDDGSAIRQRLQAACDSFISIEQCTTQAAAQQIMDDGVDILVDLKGYTTDARPEILALRPAPVQVNWLGYPGTMGADFIDYILADDFIIPPGQEHHYTEQVVRLPGCYQPNDRQRPIDPVTPSRAECGLPDNAFVFCCFNQSYKITPEMFDLWMRLLTAVSGSVLWLLEWNALAPANLRREAAARGIDPSRLVFGAKLPLAQHLARYRLADLFIDTFPVGAHTTASDALWAGLPVLTLAGETFISRVAGSVLRAAGLAELVTDAPAEYEALALALAQDPARLAALKQRLAVTRDAVPLFDTPRLVRHLEAAYEKMAERYQASHLKASQERHEK